MNKFIDAAIDKIVPTKDNPRESAHKTNGTLKNLIASVKSYGVMVPVLLRPHPDKPGFFDLRDGERRLYAAQQAKIKTIPAVLSDMNDIEAFETTMLGNAARLDLDVMEEITIVATYLNKYKGDTKAIADKMHMTEHQVRLRANAVNLSKNWKKALEKKESKYRLLSAEHFDLVARLPHEIQDDLLGTNRTYRILVDQWGRVSSIKHLEKYINDHYLHALAKAPWDLDNKVNNITACNDCPKRSDVQGQTDLWEDPKDKQNKTALCLDGLCWEEKVLYGVRVNLVLAKNSGAGKPLHYGTIHWSGQNAQNAKPLGIKKDDIISTKEMIKAKKSDKNVKRIFMTDGPNTGKVVLMKTKVNAVLGREKKKTAGGIKTLALRKELYHGLRLKVIYPKLIEAIESCLEPKDKSLKFAAAVAAVYGTTDNWWFKDLSYGKKSRDWLVAWLCFGNQVDMKQGKYWDNKGDTIEADLAGAIWLRARGCFSNIVPFKPNAEDALKAEQKCKDVGVLVGFDWDKALKEAIEEKPDPKVWTRLKADGTPK